MLHAGGAQPAFFGVPALRLMLACRAAVRFFSTSNQNGAPSEIAVADNASPSTFSRPASQPCAHRAAHSPSAQPKRRPLVSSVRSRSSACCSTLRASAVHWFMASCVSWAADADDNGDDGIFGDGVEHQLLTVTGDVTSGLAATFTAVV